MLEVNARTVVARALGPETSDLVLADVWKRYYSLESTLPVEPTIGALLTTHLAAVTLAMHEALVRYGVTEGDAYGVIHEIGWAFYTQLGEPPLLFASSLTREPKKRLRMATNLFRLFPFGTPGYVWHDVPSEPDVVAFDCTRCPVAEFFAKHQASELCVRTWCDFDYPLAEKWGGRLERSGTLAMGKSHCDFRWYPDAATGTPERQNEKGKS